ncbi:MAG: hypothetical protein Q4A07_02245 [Coriobacteriales bacterium]|nr:hypothetical protein [Coriobacteriales bacterium]
MRTRRSAIIATFCLLFVAQVSYLVYTAWVAGGEPGPIYIGLTIMSAIVDVAICYGTIRRAEAFKRAYKDEAAAQISLSLAEYGERLAHTDQVTRRLAQNVDAELRDSQEALDRGDLTALKAHLNKSVDIASRAVAPKCANVMVSALLESKESECQAAGVELQAHVALPVELPVSDDVAGAVFLYLMDKALKECRALADARALPAGAAIVVRSKVSAGQFFVQVTGPCQSQVDLRGENGLRYVDAIAAEHGGMTSYEQEGETLDLSVMLPVVAQRS